MAYITGGGSNGFLWDRATSDWKKTSPGEDLTGEMLIELRRIRLALMIQTDDALSIHDAEGS